MKNMQIGESIIPHLTNKMLGFTIGVNFKSRRTFNSESYELISRNRDLVEVGTSINNLRKILLWK